MKTFDKRQQERVAKRNRHQRAQNKLMHKLGGRFSHEWAIKRHQIEMRVSLVRYHQFNRKMKYLLSIGDMPGVEKLKAKWGLQK